MSPDLKPIGYFWQELNSKSIDAFQKNLRKMKCVTIEDERNLTTETTTNLIENCQIKHICDHFGIIVLITLSEHLLRVCFINAVEFGFKTRIHFPYFVLFTVKNSAFYWIIDKLLICRRCTNNFVGNFKF